MISLVKALALLHVAAGFTALVVAPIAMATLKGGPTHRRWGTVYYRAMVVVALSAIVLGVVHPNLFLTLLAVFSFYTAFSGYRAVARRRVDAKRPDLVGWAMAILTLAASGTLVLLGLSQPTEAWRRIGVVAVVLGSVGIMLAARDVAAMSRPPVDPMAWWYAHMTRMLGSYIAAVTAFSVVNFAVLPLTARWLWPTVIGTPLIVLWT